MSAKRVLVHLKATVEGREISEDFECLRSEMFQSIEHALRGQGAIARFSRIMVYIYPSSDEPIFTAPQSNREAAK